MLEAITTWQLIKIGFCLGIGFTLWNIIATAIVAVFAVLSGK